MPNDTIVFVKFDSNYSKANSTKEVILLTSKDNESSKFLGLNKEYATLIILPLLSFVLALLFNFIRAKLKLKSKLRLNQNFLFTWVKLIGNQIDKQVKVIKEFTNLLASENYATKYFHKFDLHLDKLCVLESPELVQLFVTNRKGYQDENNELLFTWENSVSFLKRKDLNIVEILESYKTFRKDSESDWSNKILGFHSAYVKFLQSEISENATTKNKNVSAINKLVTEWKDSNSKDKKYTYESLLCPLHEPCAGFISQFPKNENIVILSNQISALKNSYTSIEKTRLFYSNTLNLYAEDLEKGKDSLFETKRKFKLKGLKSFLFVK